MLNKALSLFTHSSPLIFYLKYLTSASFRIESAFQDATTLPITHQTRYVFFSDCHRGTGNSNDNFLRNANQYLAALQYYYQHDFHYIEVGDGDELWENPKIQPILEIHEHIFRQLRAFRDSGRLNLLYGNHDIIKRSSLFHADPFSFSESLILQSKAPAIHLRVVHGHQADFFNSILWRTARFLVRHIWRPLESFGISDPTSAAQNTKKKNRLEQKYISYAQKKNCYLLTGHTHRPTLCTEQSPYCNCGSCVHPTCITCIELCGYQMHLVKWCIHAEKNGHFDTIYSKCPPVCPIYVKREIIHSETLQPLSE